MQSDEEGESEQIERAEYWQNLGDLDQQVLIEEYKEAGEEVRYRDSLMHNSYYLIAIALVFFMGNIITWTGGNLQSIADNPASFSLLFGSTGGLLLIFVSLVMLTYNKKRVYAEYHRRDIEEGLVRALRNEKKIADEARPHAIQKYVLQNQVPWRHPNSDNQNTSRTNELMNRILNNNISDYAAVLFVLGIVLLIAGLLSPLYLFV